MALKKEKETKNKTHPETMPRGGEVGGEKLSTWDYLQWNYLSKMKVKLKTFPDKQNLRATVASMPASQVVVKEALPPKGKITTDSMLEI